MKKTVKENVNTQKKTGQEKRQRKKERQIETIGKTKREYNGKKKRITVQQRQTKGCAKGWLLHSYSIKKTFVRLDWMLLGQLSEDQRKLVIETGDRHLMEACQKKI